MNLKSVAVSVAGLMLVASCSTSKTDLPYFKDIDTAKLQNLLQDYLPTIKPDDELLITINSSVPKATAHYNLPLSNPAMMDKITSAATPKEQTYVVDSKGDINMPVIGKMHVAGMTCEQLCEKIESIVRKDVADAMVKVVMVNFIVNVGGEVAKPGTVPVTHNRFSVLDAISATGDLTPYGERSNVLIIREENGKRHFERLNLNSAESLNSPYFYLRQNDYVYVEPNEIRQANARFNQDNSYKLTVISTIVSAASVIASLVIALTVK